MTEPIAVDSPVKPASPRPASLPATLAGVAASAAAAAVLPVPLPLPVALPKIDSPPKLPDPPKSASATVTPTPAPMSAPHTGLLARVTKRQLTIGASAVFSLVAGVGAVRLMFPPKADPAPTAPATGWAAEQPVRSNAPPAPAATPTPPAPEVVPAVSPFGPVTVPPAPATAAVPPAPLFPSSLPPSAKPREITPIGGTLPPPAAVLEPTPPAFVPPAPAYTPTPAPYTPPAPVSVPPPPSFDGFPPIPTVVPAAAALPPLPGGPAVPPPPGGPAVPPLPAGPASPPPIPAAPGGMGAPAVPPPPMDLFPPAPATPPAPPASPVPSPAPGGTLPPIPTGPGGPSVLPAVPPAPAAVPDPRTPGVLPPVDVTPKPDPRPTPPKDDPAAPGIPAAFTKPGGTTDVKPTVAASAPRTDFDVDLYDPKANDSYESISQDIYNDKRFAAALRAFNRNQPLQGGRFVELPPIYILKKRFPGQAGSVTPIGGTGSVPPSTGPNWAAAGDKPEPVPARTTGAVNTRGVYVIPQGGMTMKAVARATLGSEQRWQDIWDLNRQYTDPSQVLPAGTELKLPSDARQP